MDELIGASVELGRIIRSSSLLFKTVYDVSTRAVHLFQGNMAALQGQSAQQVMGDVSTRMNAQLHFSAFLDEKLRLVVDQLKRVSYFVALYMRS